jgi:hypothetical protein
MILTSTGDIWAVVGPSSNRARAAYGVAEQAAAVRGGDPDVVVRAPVAQVERPTVPAMGPTWEGVPVAVLGTTSSPTLAMKSFPSRSSPRTEDGAPPHRSVNTHDTRPTSKQREWPQPLTQVASGHYVLPIISNT